MRRLTAVLLPLPLGSSNNCSIPTDVTGNNDLSLVSEPTPPSAPKSADPAASRAAVRHVAVGPEEAGQRLDKALESLLSGVPRSRIFRLIRRGEVRVNGRRAEPAQRLAAGDDLRLPPVRAPEPSEAGAPRVPPGLIRAVEEAVLFQDERVLVLNKPSGIAVHGGSGLSFGVIEALRASRPKESLELVHRLDRDTSGCLIVARRNSALRVLHALMREGAVQKSYLVLVTGRWGLGHKHINAPLRTDLRVGGERTVKVDAQGKQAHTEFRLIEHFGNRASLLEATLHTGRTHQIRVHAAHCGHPVLGDEKYGDPARNAELEGLGLRRLFLHAHAVSFTWPGGHEQTFSAPLPADLRALLDQLSPRRRARPEARQGTS